MRRLLIRSAIGCLVAVIHTPHASAQTPAEKAWASARPKCVEWIKTRGTDPARYVASKFKTHDLVLLGETHEIRENCEFVASLVEPLYKAGVRTLLTEFVRSRFNKDLEAIVTAKTYDEQRVRALFRKGPWPTWGYKEYMDIVRAVWSLNRKLPGCAKMFRIVGVDSDWKQLDLMRAQSGAERFKTIFNRENHMTGVVEREVFKNGHKAVLHIGMAHTVLHGMRLAAQLRKKYEKRIFAVSLHNQVPGAKFSQFLEDAVAVAGRKRAGFDITGSPLGPLRGDGVGFRVLGPKGTFQTMANGYVLLKPLKQLSPVTWVDGFITRETFEEARAVAEGLRMVPKGKFTTPEQLDRALAARMRNRKRR